MTDYAEDRLIQNILLDAIAEEYATELVSTEVVTTSVHFQHQMKRMLANPNKWVKRHRQPLWRKYLQKVAVFLLVCSITFGTVMVVSPTVRATVIEWVIEWYETYIVYRFFGTSDISEMPRYNITELPSGYNSVGKTREVVDGMVIIYESEENMIYFEYAHTEDGSALIVNIEGVEIYEIRVNESYGHLYLSKDSKESNIIIWYDEQEKIQFMIDGFVSQDELLKMARSVSLYNTTK